MKLLLRLAGLLMVSCLCISKVFAATTSDYTINMYFNPVGALFGISNLGADFVVTDSVALGPKVEFATYSGNGISATSYGIGGHLVHYFNNKVFTNSWVGNYGLSWVTAQANSNNATGFGARAMVGYAWFFEGGFNVNVGGGIQYISLDFTKLGLGSLNGFVPAVDLNLGWVF